MRSTRGYWLVPLAALAGIFLDIPTTRADTPTCTLAGLTLLQAYSKAVANGYRFQCMDTLASRTNANVWSEILSSNRVVPLVPLPSGELICLGKSTQNSSKITGGLFANKDPHSGETNLTALRNGWSLVDFTLTGASGFGGFTIPAFKVGVVRYEVAVESAGKSYDFRVKQVRIKKTGGSCANAVNEAFGPQKGATGETVCSVNIVQAQARALQKGYTFDCWDNGGNPEHMVPLPTGNSLQCFGRTHSKFGLATFLFRNSQSGHSTLKNGWKLLSYTVNGVSKHGGYWERGQGVVSFNVRMAQNTSYNVGITDLKLAKAGGNCSKVLDEAFGP
ncbi:MAG: hypothetical protein R3B13_28235 [Polyangiaceae bacterium]